MQKCRFGVVPTAVAAGKNEAELTGVPYLSVSFVPWAIPWDDPERPMDKRILYSAIEGLVHLITSLPLNRIRKGLGPPPVGRAGFASTRLNLIPISPLVYPPNLLWERHHRMMGYWFSEAPNEWRPPEGLIAFLDGGEPPTLISLGARLWMLRS